MKYLFEKAKTADMRIDISIALFAKIPAAKGIAI